MERLCIYLENNLKKNRALIGLKFYQVIRLRSRDFYWLTVYDLSSYHFFKIRNSGQEECH